MSSSKTTNIATSEAGEGAGITLSDLVRQVAERIGKRPKKSPGGNALVGVVAAPVIAVAPARERRDVETESEQIERETDKNERVRGKISKSYVGRLRRYRAMMQKLGFERAFEALPQQIQWAMLSRKSPDPVVEFDASFPAGGDGPALRRTIEKRFRDATFEWDGKTINWREYHAIIPALSEATRLEPTLSKRTPEFTKFCDAIRPRLTQILDDCVKPAAWAIFIAVNDPIIQRNRCDGRLIVSRYEGETNEHGKLTSRIVVSAADPQVREVKLDGVGRRMFRPVYTFGKLQWTSWKGAHLGLTGSAGEREYPVYVQSHALVQLYDRLDEPSARPYLDYWMTSSLAEPVIVDRSGAELLVECRLNDQRVGYLVVTPIHEPALIAVRTFLFLTMEQTPEARKLEKRLRLGRHDLDWLRLLTLSGFTRTDLGSDAALREKLDACGCGHLFDLCDSDFTPQPGAAEELRRYLRLAA